MLPFQNIVDFSKNDKPLIFVRFNLEAIQIQIQNMVPNIDTNTRYNTSLEYYMIMDIVQIWDMGYGF